MPAQLICPSCGRALTVSDNAPAKLTCPNCLGKLINPMAGQVRPMKVIPVDEQVARDTASTRYLFVGLVIFVALGAWLTAAAIGGASAVFHLIILGLILAFLVVAIIGAQRMEQGRPAGDLRVDSALPPPQALSGGGPPVLPYRNYRGFTPTEPTNTGAVVGGFVAAIGVCAAGFFTLGATVGSAQGYHSLILLAVVTAVLAFMFSTPVLAHRPGWNGYGRGVTIGLTLGLIALGPCAFCYTMTLS